MKMIIVYDTKYGNAKRIAETIGDGAKGVAGTEVEVSHVRDVDPGQLAGYDAIVVGSPTHMARPLRSVKKLIRNMAAQPLQGKVVAAFETWGSAPGRGLARTEGYLKEIAGVTLVAPGLSAKVGGVKGPLLDEELPKSRDFGTKIAQHSAQG